MSTSGLDLGVLQRLLARERPALLYTMPNFHNPTGIVTSQVHREELLAICQRHAVPIIEEGFEEELAYFGRAALPIKSMDRHRIVLSIGAFSKIMFLGGQVGWLTADRQVIERLAAVKALTDSASNTALQAGIHELCRQGLYDLYVKRMLGAFRKRMTTALRALRRHLPPDLAEWIEPGGGYMIWLKLRRPWHGTPLVRRLLDHGVIVTPGSIFFQRPVPDKYFRISISSVTEEQIEKGIKRIARALRQHHT